MKIGIKSRTDIITNSSTEVYEIIINGSPKRVEEVLQGILDTLDWVGHDTARVTTEENVITLTGIEDNSIPFPLINLLEKGKFKEWFDEISEIKSRRI